MPGNRKNAVYPEAWVLDLDRFLIGDQLYSLYYEAAANILGSDVLYVTRMETEARSESFDASDWLKAYYPEKRVDIETAFLEAAQGRDMLQEGGSELLDYLEEKGVPFLILTYGGETNQKLKLKAAKLDRVPHIITSTKRKAEVVTTWYDDEAGHFALPLDPLVFAASIVLGDDKLVAFEHLPEKVRGYLVRSDLPGSIELPAGVTWANTLCDVIRIENNN